MSYEKLVRSLPSRPPAQGIHGECCAHCPSAHGISDPECAEIATWNKAQRIETVFPCAWRPSKFCKGYCDNMGVTERDLTLPTSGAFNQ